MKPTYFRASKIVAFAFISGGFITWGTQLYKESIIYFITPSDLLRTSVYTKQNKTYKVGGYVQKGSIKKIDYDTVQFNISDQKEVTDPKQLIIVEFRGKLPNLFGENQQVIVQGKYINSILTAEIALSKHDEYYKK